ncbi:MAG: hypothetical protein ACREK9_02245 [Candidatus Rokuibacteriota bacterium]
MADYADGSSVKGMRPGGGRPGEIKPGAGHRGHRLTDPHGPRGGFRERHFGQIARAHRLPHHQRGHGR